MAFRSLQGSLVRRRGAAGPLMAVIASCLLLGCGQEAPPRLPSDAPPAADSTKPNDSQATPVEEEWPFEHARNTAVITLTRIMNGSRPILYVVHDEDGDWQFLDGDDVSEEDAATVSLKNVVDRDPSLKTLADLPVGWAAERTGVDQPWQRTRR